MVQKCVSLIEEWSNPFQRAEKLVPLSSGQQAPDGVKQDMLKVKKIGEKNYKNLLITGFHLIQWDSTNQSEKNIYLNQA